MILSVVFSKSTGEIVVSSDIDEIAVEVNTNSVQDGSDQLVFEIAVDTSVYEQINNLMDQEEIIE
jgi:hypothetical protein